MKNFTLFSGKRLIVRLALAVAMIATWGGQVWADDIVIYEEGNDIPSGWINSNISVSNNNLVCGNTAGNITSQSSFTFTNKKIVIAAIRTDDTDAYVQVACNSPSSQFSYTVASQFAYGTKKTYEMYESEDYIELITDNISVSEQKIRILMKNVMIKSIKIVDNQKLLLNEGHITAISKSAKSESVFFKYTPKNGWNTICVPFQLKLGNSYNHLSTLFGDSYSAYTFTSFSEGTLTFTNALPNTYSSINANTPILVYAESVPTCPTDGFELTSNVSISYPESESGRAKPADGVTFQGTFAPKAAGSLEGCYGVTKDGQIARAGSGTQMKGYRAYLTGLPDGSSVKMFVIDGDDATDVGLMQMVEGEDKAVYNISGQRVQKARKGLYIIGGKKVIIK